MALFSLVWSFYGLFYGLFMAFYGISFYGLSWQNIVFFAVIDPIHSVLLRLQRNISSKENEKVFVAYGLNDCRADVMLQRMPPYIILGTIRCRVS